MDHFGIGAGVAGALEIYFRASSGTGRTTSLVDSVKDGDRVVFVDPRRASRVEALCKERGVQIETVVYDPADPGYLYFRGSVPGDGRLMFDHVWVEEFYRLALRGCAETIDRLQREISGDGAAHRETTRAAEEVSRWSTSDV